MPAVLLVVGVRAGVGVHETVFEGAIHKDGEFASGRGDGFGFTDAERDAAVEGAVCVRPRYMAASRRRAAGSGIPGEPRCRRAEPVAL